MPHRLVYLLDPTAFDILIERPAVSVARVHVYGHVWFSFFLTAFGAQDL
jgi:hypothetical protein